MVRFRFWFEASNETPTFIAVVQAFSALATASRELFKSRESKVFNFNPLPSLSSVRWRVIVIVRSPSLSQNAGEAMAKPVAASIMVRFSGDKPDWGVPKAGHLGWVPSSAFPCPSAELATGAAKTACCLSSSTKTDFRLPMLVLLSTISRSDS